LLRSSPRGPLGDRSPRRSPRGSCCGDLCGTTATAGTYCCLDDLIYIYIYIQSLAAYACILLYHDLGRLKHEQCRLINGIRRRSELDALALTLSGLAEQFPNFFAKIYRLSARSIYCVPMNFVSMHDQTFHCVSHSNAFTE
jgi:hypothetical protein